MDAFSTLSETQRGLIGSLAAAGIDYVVIGGYATRFHGLDQPAKDLDLLVGYDVDTAEKLFGVLSHVGTMDPLTGRQKLVTPKIQIRWFHVEFLTSIDGMNFADVRRRARHTTVHGFSVLVASAEHMLVNCNT
jgi:hypothetical protein